MKMKDQDLKVLEDMNRNFAVVLRLMDLADLASVAFHLGEYQTAFVALKDYRALRQENAEVIHKDPADV